MIAMPWRFSRSMRSNSRSVSRAVSEVVGSSKMMMRASAPSALAISTSWRSPWRQAADRRVGARSRSTAARSSLALFAHGAPIDEGQAGDELGEAGDEEVLRDGQVGEEVELLVDEGDAARLRRRAGRAGA